MPRVGQLLSALLVALIGVLVVQMFLLAGMHQQLANTQTSPPVDQDLPSLPAPQLESPLAAAPAPPETSFPEAPHVRPIVIVVTVPDLPAGVEDREQAVIEHFIAASGAPIQQNPATPDAVLERFIALTDEPIRSSAP